MGKDGFAGDKKAPMRSPLADAEHRLIQAWVGRFPSWVESYHLTMLTVVWTLGLIGFGALAQDNLHWLWMSSLMLFLQWFTDSFDGSLGRMRGTGLIKWGFYMDHFLDFVFMSSIFIGYTFLCEGVTQFLMIMLMMLYGAAMVHSFLMFAATNSFQITYMGIGPTEVRLFFVGINTLVIIFGAETLDVLTPSLFVFGACGLTYMVREGQKLVWDMDMDAKADAERERE